jgi:N-acetylmuramoyl-L-alanine amidase
MKFRATRKTAASQVAGAGKVFLFLAFMLFAACAFAGELVNLKYLVKETGAAVAVDSDNDSFVISKGGNSATIILNYPYIISGDRVIKAETPPFVNGGNVFFSQGACDAMTAILTAEEVSPAVQAQATEPVSTATKELRTEAAKPEPTATQEESAQEVKISGENDKGNSGNNDKGSKKIIVLDPGHGGNDPGAIGPTGYREKDAVLDIGLKLRNRLRGLKNLKVYMTRDDDTFIPLKERTIFANRKKADLFVSLHCNSSPASRVSGTRAYIYGRIASSKEAEEAANFENKKVNAFEVLLNDLKRGAFEYLSIQSAGYIQHSLVKELSLKWTPTERAPFYVIANTNMPSTLIETAFISNPAEEKKLANESFRSKVADGIYDGIIEYLDRIK